MMNNFKYRHEFKYLCSDIQLEIITNRLQNLLDYDTNANNGTYTIRSMYFDNFENKCYYENENGTDPREKFRIRIYNSNENRILLECKRKENSKTHKTSCLLTKNEYNEFINGGTLENFSNKNTLNKKFTLLMKTQLYKPVVIVEYDRTPFVYHNGNVRITIDKNIRSSNDFEHFFDKNIPTREILPLGQHLLEVKFDEFLPDFIKQTIQTDNLQRTNFSKYYLCRKYSLGG